MEKACNPTPKTIGRLLDELEAEVQSKAFLNGNHIKMQHCIKKINLIRDEIIKRVESVGE